jgi:pyroglutamyl-peptidase
MSATLLITGFGPFPGAPSNPTGALVMALAHLRDPALRNVRRVAHVFATSYAAVDRELPALLARERPDVLLMFGLATHRRHVSIETQARNAISRAVADASGALPAASLIAPGARAVLPLRAPARRLLDAVRAAGMPASLSDDAGSYLCNYLCWRAGEAAASSGGPRLVAFVHVPNVHAAGIRVPTSRRLHRPRTPARPPFRLDQLISAGAAIMRATLGAAPTPRPARR